MRLRCKRLPDNGSADAGNYVDQSDYHYYFRHGYRRGYTDGYNQRAQYGTTSNGTPIILAAILATIFGLKAIR